MLLKQTLFIIYNFIYIFILKCETFYDLQIHINQVCYYNTFSYAGIIEADTRSKMTSTQLTSTPASASFIDVEKTPSVSAPESQIASRKSPESPAKAVMRPFRDVKKKESLSFLDPFDITIDITLQESDEEADDDPDFEPDFHMSSVLPENLQNFPDVTFEEAVFGQEEAAESDGEEAEVASPAVGQKKIVCQEGHRSTRWCSQPTLNRGVFSGDFLISATTVLSGNNFGKMELWADMLQLKFPSASKFFRIQRTYLVPSVDRYWKTHQQDLFQSLRGKDVVILGVLLEMF
ncbi:hypothetical protein MAR_035687 [Mya arenaria]|uniref:Uncharacterized protein n=1 Tax=Mya arenaria TaxID=6604 RepID=A0ABY7EPG6_MYAAR|nr:hypothetical protein MAR_035687 [Mya arenaria]